MRSGDRFSLFPMAGVTGRSEGLKWPIAGLQFAPDARGGTSNQALGPVRLQMDGPGMLVIVPRARLDVALAGLLAA
jgi:thiamine pyrophosphokinase